MAEIRAEIGIVTSHDRSISLAIFLSIDFIPFLIPHAIIALDETWVVDTGNPE